MADAENKLDWPAVKCSRCDSPAILVGWFDDGCYCDRTPLQALCAQHNCSAPVGEMLADLIQPRPATAWRPIITADENPDLVIEVFAPGREGLDDLVSLCRWHPDAGFCIDELRYVTHWRRHAPPL